MRRNEVQRYAPKAFAQSILAGEVWAEMHENPKGEYVLAAALTEQAREIVKWLRTTAGEGWDNEAADAAFTQRLVDFVNHKADAIEGKHCPRAITDTEPGTD